MEETKTSPATWKASLQLLLKERISKSGRQPRIAVLGIGNPFRSDDGAGVLVARGLCERQCAQDTDHLLIIEAGQAPENAAGVLRTFAPDLVLMIDAADMGETPGTIKWIPEESIDGMSASTHSLPLSMLAHYLRLEMNCAVVLLGIQPQSNDVGEAVSVEVLEAVNGTVHVLDEMIVYNCFTYLAIDKER